MGTNSALWHEGYITALRDFDIHPSDEDLSFRMSRNPHADPIARRELTDNERHEIRASLRYHFDDCASDELEEQATIIDVVVERILARRPARSA